MHRPIGAIGVQDIGNHLHGLKIQHHLHYACFQLRKAYCLRKSSEKLRFRVDIRVRVSARVKVCCRRGAVGDYRPVATTVRIYNSLHPGDGRCPQW